jgi:hypothetical protein
MTRVFASPPLSSADGAMIATISTGPGGGLPQPRVAWFGCETGLFRKSGKWLVRAAKATAAAMIRSATGIQY